MATEILPQLKSYFSRAINKLSQTPRDDILPLLQRSIRRRLGEKYSPQRRRMGALLRDYIGRTFPEKEAPVITNLRYSDRGWESETYSFTLAWGSMGSRTTEELILCIYPEGVAGQKANNEYRALSSLHKVGYPVPQIKHYEQNGHLLSHQRPFVIMEYIQGQRLWQPLLDSSGEARERLLADFCGLFARLHALDWRTLAVEPAPDWTGAADQLMTRYLRERQLEVEQLILPGFRPSWEWIFAQGEQIASSGPSIAHFDFHPGNIILCDSADARCGGVAVIDWTAVNLADYRFDLAWTMLLLSSYFGDDIRVPFLRQYERQSGRKVVDVEYFEAAACFSRLLNICVATTQSAAKVGLRAGLEKQIVQQAPLTRRIYDRYRELTNFAIPEVQQFLQRAGAWSTLIAISASNCIEAQSLLPYIGA